MFILKWGAYAAAAGYVLKNIDIFALLGAMCGSFLFMCGIERGGSLIKLIIAVYLLVKLFTGAIV